MTAPNVVAKWSSWAPQLQSVLRIVAALLFLHVGTAKLFAVPVAILPNGATAPIWSLLGLAGTLETFGGLCLLLGLFTRRSEEHTSELQSRFDLVCRLLLEKKKENISPLNREKKKTTSSKLQLK